MRLVSHEELLNAISMGAPIPADESFQETAKAVPTQPSERRYESMPEGPETSHQQPKVVTVQATATQATATQETAQQAAGTRVEEVGNAVQVDLASVLGMAAGSNLSIALAQERIQESYARELAAKSLWLPSIRAGISYNRHTGPLQASEGRVLNVNRSSLQAGMGLNAVGAGTPMLPGVSMRFHLRDAVFEPQVASSGTAAQYYEKRAVTNDTLFRVALGYLELLAAAQNKSIALQTEENAKKLADLTSSFARAGTGLQSDADRASTEWTVRKNNVLRAEEQFVTASARLAEMLRLSPDVKLLPTESVVVPLHLAPSCNHVRELIGLALAERPELAQSQQLVAQAAARLRQEKTSPWLPSLLLGVSSSGFGGALGTSIPDVNGRLDVDAAVFWEIRNLGFGEVAARRGARSRLEQSRLVELQQMDRVAREVVEAHAQIQARAGQIAIAEQGFKAATEALRRDLDRIQQGQGLPLEALQSLQALDQAQREYLRTILEYNQAQFRMQWAIGWARSIS